MEGRFVNIAKEIYEIASVVGVSVQDLEQIVGGANCYPSIQKGACCSLAFFISIKGSMAKGRGHLSFPQVLDEFVRHMQGHCAGITRDAVIITNDWEHWSYEQWYENIENIKLGGVHLEAYLISKGSHITQINI